MITQPFVGRIMFVLKITTRLVLGLSKQEALDADPKALQQSSFIGNLDWAGNTTFFIIEEAKETILDFSQWSVKYCECCTS